MGNRFFDDYFATFTKFGNAGIIWILICSILLIYKPTRKLGFLALVALLFEFTLNDLILKPIFARPRPFMTFEIYPIIKQPSGFSFPSGHAASSLAVATMLLIHKQPGRHFIMVLALLMAFSRVYLMVHYPFDVLMGILVGVLSAFIVYKVSKNRGFDASIVSNQPPME